MKAKTLLLLAISVISLLGCVRNNPKPVWLEISEWTLQSNPNSTNDPGFLSHKFSDAWVYVDNKLVGVFEVPCKIPVMMSGNNKSIRIYPTIRNNGIQATKKIYPFVEPFEGTYDLEPGNTISIQPTTQYYSNCKFWIEDFASSSPKFLTDTSSNASVVYETNSAIALDGRYAHINLNASDSMWLGVCTEIVDLPKGGKEVYLEMDYRSTNPILTGILAVFSDQSTTDNPMVSTNAQSLADLKWNKIYVDLKEVVSYYVSAIGYKLYLKTTLSVGSTSADVYIDNVRLVYF